MTAKKVESQKTESQKVQDPLDIALFDAATSSYITDVPLSVAFSKSCKLLDISQERQAELKGKIQERSALFAKLSQPERRLRLFRIMLAMERK